MANFDQFLPMLLQLEGGFVNHPADPGGATNMGITMATFGGAAQSLLGVPATLENLRNLTKEQAGVLYKRLYWDKAGGDAIGSQVLANFIVDFYVNAGANAIKVLQNVLNELGVQPPVAEDGSMGPATLCALCDADQRSVYAQLRQGRAAYYRELVRQRPQMGCFLNGWLSRIEAFPKP